MLRMSTGCRAPGQRLAPRQPAEIHRAAVLVERDEAVEDLRHRRREDLLGRRALEQSRGRLVDVDQPVVRRLDRDRLGQVPEDRLELALGRAELGEEARVVEGGGRAAGELDCEAQVLLVVRHAPLAADEGEDSERATARDKGDRDPACVAQAPHVLEVPGRQRDLVEMLGGHDRDELRAAGARGDRDGVRARGIDGPAPPRVEDGLGDARLGGVAGAGAQRAVGLEQVDGRDVGQPGDREGDDLREALLGVERRGEQLARARDDVRLDARRPLAGQCGLRRALGALEALPRIGCGDGEEAPGHDDDDLDDVLGGEQALVDRAERHGQHDGERRDRDRGGRGRLHRGEERAEHEQRDQDGVGPDEHVDDREHDDERRPGSGGRGRVHAIRQIPHWPRC